MISPRRAALRSAGVLLGAAVIGGGLMLLDLRTVEHGNRIYHTGDVPRAAEIYSDVLGGRSTTDTVSAPLSNTQHFTQYNLGTALLTLDGDSAESLLRGTTSATASSLPWAA
jgi:hypothetical protein